MTKLYLGTLFTLLLVISSTLSGCKRQKCIKTYSYNSTSVTWTAYKFTSKVGLKGTFNSVNAYGTSTDQEDWTKVLLNARFSIPVAGLNTNMNYRDNNIKDHFFAKMSSTEFLEGKIISLNEENAIVEIRMNQTTFPVSMEVKRNENVVYFNSVIDLNNWNAQASMDSLHTLCYDLHKGPDGISKFWPDVKLEIVTLLKEGKKCE